MNIRNLSKPFFIAAATSAVVGGLGSYVWKLESRPPILEVYVFSLSSGRSMFIRTPEDKRILIDGGANSEVIRKITSILPFYSKRIDTVIATNSEGKNVSGLIDVIQRYDVNEVYIPGINLEVLGIASSSDQIFKTFTDIVRNGNIQIFELISNDNVYLDKNISIKIIFPVIQERFAYSKTSAPELLFNISYDQNSLTFLGNATNKIQKYIASTSNTIGKTDVLIISHSALPTNMSPVLIDKLQPKYLVYSKLLKNKIAKTKISVNKKTITDPLSYIPNKNKLNIKEKGTIRIKSNGRELELTAISE